MAGLLPSSLAICRPGENVCVCLCMCVMCNYVPTTQREERGDEKVTGTKAERKGYARRDLEVLRIFFTHNCLSLLLSTVSGLSHTSTFYRCIRVPVRHRVALPPKYL